MNENIKQNKDLSSAMFICVITTVISAFLYASISHIFGKNVNIFIIINLLFLAFMMMLLKMFITRVYKPLKKIEKAMLVLEKGSSDFQIDFDEKNDVYPLSIHLNSMLINLKASMDREYTTGILKKQAEINALQSQINPHFLYNVLDSIRGHALMEGVDEIAEMTEALSTLFRYSISSNNNLVTLENELKNIKNYFKIQQYRFNNKFDLNIKLDGDPDELLSYRLPKLTIQPILENSIYHGLEMKLDKGTINIRAEATHDRLLIWISDDGVGMDRQQLERVNKKLNDKSGIQQENSEGKKAGIALINVNQRIKMLFGEEYGIYISSTPNLGTDVDIVLPVVKSE